MSAHTSVNFTQNYIVYRPLEQGVYPIRESEWKRLKSLIEAIIPQNRVYQNLSSIFFGVFISSVFQVITMPENTVSNWLAPTTWSIFTISLMGSVALLFLDREQSKYIQISSKGVVSEMELLEKEFEKSSLLSSELNNESVSKQEIKEERSEQTALDFSETKDLKIDDTVYHNHFGLGKILSVEDKENDKVVTVTFKDIGIKNLSLRFANLKKVSITKK